MKKQAIQRNLPFTQSYTLLESFYSEMENGNSCDNCGKLITNIAKIQGDSDKIIRHVGMDCAGTLTGLKDSLSFEFVAKAAFQAAKGARASIQKLLKKAAADGKTVTVSAKTHEDEKNYYKEIGSGVFRVTAEPFDPRYGTWKQFPACQWGKHVYPMIKDLLTK